MSLFCHINLLKRRYLFGIISFGYLFSFQSEAALVSTKALGMGATGIAYPQDSMAAAYNPAGTAFIGDRFDISAYWLHNQGKARVHENLNPIVNRTNNIVRTANFYSPDFGINKIIPRNCILPIETSVGIVGYIENFYKTRTIPQQLLGTSPVGLEYVDGVISPNVSFKIHPCHSIGVSLNVKIQRFKLNGIENFDNALFSSAPGFVTNRGYDYSTGVGFSIGWYGYVTNWLQAGLNYTSKTSMRKLHKYKGFLANHGSLDIPEVISGGIAIEPLDCLVIAFDIEYKAWQKLRSLHNPLQPNLFTNKLGQKHGAGFGLRSQTYYHLGIAYSFNEQLTLRTGWQHARTATPNTQTAIGFLTDAAVKDYLSVGATYSFNCCHEFSFFYAHGFQNTIKGTHSIPRVFGGGDVDFEERKNVMGLSYGMNF